MCHRQSKEGGRREGKRERKDIKANTVKDRKLGERYRVIFYNIFWNFLQV